MSTENPVVRRTYKRRFSCENFLGYKIVAERVANMSWLSFLLKSKKDMGNKTTKRVKVGRYLVSSHAQNQIVNKDRNLKKVDMTSNLLLKADYVSKPETREDGSLSYARIRKKVCTHITPDTRVVKTIHKIHNPKREIEKMKKKGK